MTYATCHQEVRGDIPAYMVKINTTAFNLKKPSLLQKTQQEYLPRYWQMMHMDQKRIGPSCEDRLSELTTSQIDRIIDMEKIRRLLYDKKKKEKEVFFQFRNSNPNRHPNIYQANFLAKINAIAIKRNIRHETLEGMDQCRREKHYGQEPQKNMNAASYKYKKSYSVDCEDNKKNKKHYAEDDDEKSIASIEDELQKFQQKLERSKWVKQNLSRRKKRKFQQTKLSSNNRWFYGMSKIHIDKKNIQTLEPNQIQRYNSVDIEGQLNLLRTKTQNQLQSQQKFNSRPILKSQKTKVRYHQPLQRYKMPRVVTIE